jgi:predicted RND superfamily exporter protein
VKDVKLTLGGAGGRMMPVLWLLGTLPILGFGIDRPLDPVPFLIFSIGVSHAVQMTKTWEHEVVSGVDSLTRQALVRQALHPRHAGAASPTCSASP